MQAPIRVAIQGIRASFHDVAARKYFAGRPIEVVECATFRSTCAALSGGGADVALMAIENTIAGSILPNYSLLEAHQFRVFGEVYLRIELALLALAGQRVEDITTVQSHPMALLQCEDFFGRHPDLEIVEGADTAMSAKRVAEAGQRGHGAIAPRLAAEVYGLAVLEDGIETSKKNYTRFLCLCRQADQAKWAQPEAADKASLRFEVAHRPGSLVEVLEIFRALDLNMTKIQSLPIIGKPYQYGFHVDLEWDDPARYAEGLRQLAAKATHLTHFGDYPRGER